MGTRVIIFSIIISLLFTSCTLMTDSLNQKPRYSEVVTSFLITEDSDKLAVIGNKYHYIFTIDNDTKSLLLFDNKKNWEVSFDEFNVDLNNTITGKYRISIPMNKVEDENIKELVEQMNFYKNKNHKLYILTNRLKGKRYIAKNIPEKHKFKQPYTIIVREEHSDFRKNLNTALTPITIGLDLTVSIAVIGTIVACTAIILPLSGFQASGLLKIN